MVYLMTVILQVTEYLYRRSLLPFVPAERKMEESKSVYLVVYYSVVNVYTYVTSIVNHKRTVCVAMS